MKILFEKRKIYYKKCLFGGIEFKWKKGKWFIGRCHFKFDFVFADILTKIFGSQCYTSINRKEHYLLSSFLVLLADPAVSFWADGV